MYKESVKSPLSDSFHGAKVSLAGSICPKKIFLKGEVE